MTKKIFLQQYLGPYLIYGPGQDFNRLIPYVIKNCLQNKSFPCSNGNQLRDFIFIDDAINLIFKSLKNKRSNGKILIYVVGNL